MEKRKYTDIKEMKLDQAVAEFVSEIDKQKAQLNKIYQFSISAPNASLPGDWFWKQGNEIIAANVKTLLDNVLSGDFGKKAARFVLSKTNNKLSEDETIQVEDKLTAFKEEVDKLLKLYKDPEEGRKPTYPVDQNTIKNIETIATQITLHLEQQKKSGYVPPNQI